MQFERHRSSISSQMYNISPAVLYTVVGLLSAVVFMLIYGVRILNPTYTDWLLTGGDLTQHYLGWVAYRNGSWTFPIGMTEVLAYPMQTSVIFTDSIPCFAVLFKAISFLLPESFQYFGWWGLVCFVLQGILTAKLLRRFSGDPLPVIFTSLLLLFTPVIIQRMYNHTSLAAHWLLLMGLDIFFDRERTDTKKLLLRVCLMAVLAASTHIYLCLCAESFWQESACGSCWIKNICAACFCCAPMWQLPH